MTNPDTRPTDGTLKACRPPHWPLPSFDAKDWAQEFMRIFGTDRRADIDEELMIGWFANALMRGFDEHAWRHADTRPTDGEKLVKQPAYFTYDNEHGHRLWYFAPVDRTAPPYRIQRHVEAIIDIASDGTLAGVELIDNMPPPPANARPVAQAPADYVAAVARRIAKRQHGEDYVGYESSHREAAEDYVRAMLAAAPSREAGVEADCEDQACPPTNECVKCREPLVLRGQFWCCPSCNSSYGTNPHADCPPAPQPDVTAEVKNEG